MKSILTCLLFVAAPAWAQAPTPAPAPAKAPATKTSVPEKSVVMRPKCADCGVVTSVRVVKKELPPAASADSKPTGLVASVPFGGGKPDIGSSSKQQGGKDAVVTSETWEVAVRLDDGRYRLAILTAEPELRVGDKVKFDANGKVALRTD